MNLIQAFFVDNLEGTKHIFFLQDKEDSFDRYFEDISFSLL